MINWKHILDIRNAWAKADNDEISTQELSKVVANKLDKLYYSEDDTMFVKENLVDDFMNLALDPDTTKENFDYIWRELYDWADFNHTCWIKVY